MTSSHITSLCLFSGFSPVAVWSIHVYIAHYVCPYILHGCFPRSLLPLGRSCSSHKSLQSTAPSAPLIRTARASTTKIDAQSLYHNCPRCKPVQAHHRTHPIPGGPDEPYNVRGHILTQARNKFRIKELSIIYRWGGEVVYDSETLQKKIDEVLVSKGEAYTGPSSQTFQNRWKSQGGERAREPEFRA
jgi:hypothetical protein